MHMTIDAVRTPDDRFSNLPDFAWTPHYDEALPGYEGLRMAYIDEGAGEHTYLCLHGEPSWSFLYRKMIGVFLEAGGRVVAPDFYGFGRSDKPTDDKVYSWSFHRKALVSFIEQRDLKNVTLVCQDWGGLLGLTLPMEMPERIARLLVMNTALATGQAPPSDGFNAWKAFVAKTPDLDVGALMKRAAPELSADEVAAYNAPFVDATYKAGVRTFPSIVPVSPEMEGASVSLEAAKYLSTSWDKPTFMAVGAQDPVLGPKVMAQLRAAIAGCPEPLIIEDAGHFVQERGDVIARAALAHWQ